METDAMMIPLLAQSVSQPSDVAASTVLFYLFAILAGASAVGVVLSRNIVRTAVFLLFTLAGVAGLYFLLDGEFLAAVQLVVYAGGTLVLIIFGVMLTSKSPHIRYEPRIGEVATAILVSAAAGTALIMAIVAQFPAGQESVEQHPSMAELGQVLLGDYLIPFELISVLLLVVMIGAAYLAKARRRRGDTQ